MEAPPVAAYPQSDQKTIIKLDGGHSTVVRLSVSELAREIQEAREEHDAVNSVSLLFLQSGQHGDNGLVIDPFKVVALIRA